MNWLKKRILALESKLIPEETELTLRDGSTCRITKDGLTLLRAFDDMTNGKPSPLADLIGESVSGKNEHGLVKLIRIMKLGPITREEIEAGESEKPEHKGMN